MILRAAILVPLLLGFAAAAVDLKTIAADPNPARRARQALIYAEQACGRAGEACKANEYEQCNGLLDEIKESVELADKSLVQTGVDPRRNPRHHKDAEIRTRRIVRQVDAVRVYIHPEDMEHFESVYRRISEINDRLLAAIFGGNRKKK